MSTNINNTGPSIESLQELANKLFSALPGEKIPVGLKEIPEREVNFKNFHDDQEIFNIQNPRSSHKDPFIKDSIYIPESNTGNGINYAGQDGAKKANIHNSEFGNSLPDNFVDHTPKSQAGFGISPSAFEQGNAVNLNNPTTSFRDPNVPSEHFNHPGLKDRNVINNNLINTEFNLLNFNPEKSEPANFNGGKFNGIDFNRNDFNKSTFNKNLSDSKFTNDLLSPLATHPIGNLPFASVNDFQSNLQNPIGYKDKLVPQINFPDSQDLFNQFYFLQGKERLLSDRDNVGLYGRNINSGNAIKGALTKNFDVNFIRKDFPILGEQVNGKQLIWFDNAATTQKPQQVIDRISYFYQHENSNIHRAAHELAARATDAYEGARTKIQRFLNAGSINEIVFVRGATEAINLVAKSWGEQTLNSGDEIVISQLEHHANIVPWKQLADKKGLKIKVIPVDDDGQIILSEYGKILTPKTKLVAITHVSNALGTITPLKEIIEMAHSIGAKVLVDGAQSVSHIKVDLQYLDPDFFVFSGHKIFGPTGIGVLYGKEELLNSMPPWQGGGNMIQDVTFDKIIYHKAPGRFEAGTGNIADAVGLGAAIDYVNKIGIEFIGHYEEYLLSYATRLLKDIPGIRLIGTAAKKASVASFVLDGHKTEDIGTELNKQGIAVRSGHHCAQPILRRFCVETSVRPSFAFYNTCAEIDVMIDTLHKIQGRRNKF